MTSKEGPREHTVGLRPQTEAKAWEERITPERIADLTPDELQAIVQELRVHQIQLEMHNEDLQRARTELDVSRARLFDLYERAPVGYLTVGKNGLIQEINSTAAALLGIPRASLLQQPFSRFVFSEDLDLYNHDQRLGFRADEARVLDLRLVKPDHTIVWTQLVVTTLYQIDDMCISLVVINDITEHKLLEIALQESEERYRILFESASDAIFFVDGTSGRILEANTRASELYGYALEELQASNCQDLAANQDDSRWLISGAMSKPDGVLIAPSQRHRKKDGTLFSAEITARSLPLGGQPRFLMAVRDISERKQIETVMAARLRLLRAANTLSLEELIQATLDEAEALTSSQIGFYHFMDPDQNTITLQAWSTNTLERMCTADGVWADCIPSRRAGIHNDYASLLHRKRIPTGHVPVIRQLVVPLQREEAIVALVGVGNKPSDYDEQDVQIVTALADLAWDIAERKRAETALQESEERYRLLFESASDALFLIAADTGRVLHANKRVSDLYGYGLDEILTMVATDFSAEPEQTRQFIREAQAYPDQIFGVRLRRHRKKDGAVFPVEITGRSFPLRGLQRLLIAVRDVSERVAAEEGLRASEQLRLQEQQMSHARLKEQAESLTSIYEALDSVGLIVGELDKNDVRVRIFNSGAVKMFGYSQDEAVGKSIALIYPPELVNIIPERVQRFSKGKPMLSFNMILVRKSGERFPAVVSVHPFDVHDGRFRKVVGIFRDISELIQAQQQLEAINEDLERRVEARTLELQETQKQYLHAEKFSAIGKLSASIAHEFNNPLQGILSILKGLKKRAILEEEDRELLNAAIGEGDRIKDLIRNLQEFNSPTSGKKTVMDVHKSLHSLLLLHKSEFKGKRITLKLDLAEHLPPIVAVPDQIKQVFLNLLANASDACQIPGGVITIRSWQENENVAVAIQDTGIGIKPEEIDLIFQPFYTTKPTVKGTGLGLSVSYGIVKHHGGEILVDSQPGQGATFTVFLPIKGIGTTPVAD